MNERPITNEAMHVRVASADASVRIGLAEVPTEPPSRALREFLLEQLAGEDGAAVALCIALI